MKTFKSIIVLVALCAINNVLAVAMQYGAPVPSINGANYRRFAGEYKGYLIDQNNQVDLNWVRGALAALQQDGLYNSNNFLNVLWADIEPLVNYYAQGNQAFKNATRQSLERAFNHIGGTFQVPQPTASPWASRQVVPSRPLPQVPQVQPAPPAPQAPGILFSLKTILDGALGNVYALRVQAISSYNEVLASKRGEPSLLGMLNRAIADANANVSSQGRETQLKKSIDSIYAQLKAYNIKDNAQMSQQAAVRPLPQVPQQQVSQRVRPLPKGQQRSPIASGVADFIQDSKRRGLSGIESLSDAFLTDAVGAILSGMQLTNANKAMVQEQLIKIADAVIAEQLWEVLSEPEYNKAIQIIESMIKTFMGKLQIGNRYSYGG